MPAASASSTRRHPVAVLLAGSFVYPEVKQSWPLLLQHVIAPTNASSFVFLSPDGTLLPSDPPRHEKDYITRIRHGTSTPVDSLCAAAGALMGSALTRCRAARISLPRVWADEVTHYARIQYAKLCEANQLRLEYERQTGVVHALIVRARFDLAFRATLVLPRLPLRTLLRRPIAWVIADPKPCSDRCTVGHNVYHLPNHALDHLFVLSSRTAETLCELAATLPAVPSRCSPGWIPEGQLLRHWLRVGEVRLLPAPKQLRDTPEMTLPKRAPAPFFGFDAMRVQGTVELLSFVQRKWICATRLGCEMAITNVSGTSEPTESARAILGWADDAAAREDPRSLRDGIHQPEWLQDPQGCMRRRATPQGSHGASQVGGRKGPPTGSLTLGAVLNRTFDAALLSDCAARGYC